jgi:thymidylate kinase
LGASGLAVGVHLPRRRERQVMSGRLVCFTGIDGSGKTTLSRKVARCLRDGGERAVYVYGRTVPAVSRLLMTAGRRVFLRNHNVWRDYPGYARDKQCVLKNRLLAQAYRFSVWADYLPPALSNIRGSLLLGRTVVCDRYVFDTVINDLAVHLGYDAEHIHHALASSFRLLPEPDYVFFLDLPEEVALRRKNDIPHIEYLRERRALYLLTAQLYPMVKLDGMEAPEALLDQVLCRIEAMS